MRRGKVVEPIVGTTDIYERVALLEQVQASHFENNGEQYNGAIDDRAQLMANIQAVQDDEVKAAENKADVDGETKPAEV